ncbi:MAG: zonular occludens toxin domain-containing protein [Rubrobacteraceae bacterium]
MSVTGLVNAITFVEGPLGCGKSYFAQRHVLDYLARGKVVALNYELRGAWWLTARRQSKKGKKLNDRAAHEWERGARNNAYRFDHMDELYEYRFPVKAEDQGLLVFDEGGLNLNKRMQKDRQKADEIVHDNPLATIQFYINMRKRGWTCLILAHSHDHVDSQVQDMVGGKVKLRNFAKVLVPVFKIPVSKNPRFLAFHYMGGMTKPVASEWYGLNYRVASHYQSLDEFELNPPKLGLRLQADTMKGRNWSDEPVAGAGVGLGGDRGAGTPAAERGRTPDAAPTPGTSSALDDWLSPPVRS